jgi:hypothetical protein
MARSIVELAVAACLGVVGVANVGCSSAEVGDPDDLLVTPDGTKTEPGDPAPDPTSNPDAPQATCTMQANVALSREEQRLVNTLPGKTTSFARDLLVGTGFDVFEGKLAAELCTDGKAGASSFDAAKVLVTAAGSRLWRAAVDRVQGKVVMGTLPAGDDRMLYWARLTMTKTLRAWMPSFPLSDTQRVELEWELERASRGQYDVALPAGSGYVRIVLSGFDPFTLGAPGSTDNVNIRIGNPSGAAALAYDGYELTLPSGKKARIETFVLPVSYGPFERGMEEDTLGPWFKPGPSRADVAITMSQGSGYRFKLEEYNGRFHGLFEGNDDLLTCVPVGGTVLASTVGCSIDPPERWVGYKSLPWQRDMPPQFVPSTLPITEMITANTGALVPRPPGSGASGTNAFDVVWGYDYDVFPSCAQSQTQSFYDPVSMSYPPPGNPQPPSATACARSGSGGDYLSNESAYRATLLRDAMGLTIPVGHIHTPIMTRFATGDTSSITDPTFEAYRSSIVLQGRLLIEAVAKSL